MRHRSLKECIAAERAGTGGEVGEMGETSVPVWLVFSMLTHAAREV